MLLVQPHLQGQIFCCNIISKDMLVFFNFFEFMLFLLNLDSALLVPELIDKNCM
ncbi:MAG: hypothetical protein HW410_128 [Nitrosarchaeum sp.]|jgi:hypothetical protein|nr:hypothetical protein [Nitrosarchaeum sp.]